MNGKETVAVVISLVAAVVISIALIGRYVYTTKKVTSALAAGLCESTAPGNGAIVWTTCPQAPNGR